MPRTFLEYDPTAANGGYRESHGRPGPTLRPLYITRRYGRVVYGDPNTPNLPNRLAKCHRYTDEIYKKRRTLCDSALGILMLDNPQFTQRAVDKVNEGIRQYFKTVPAKLLLGVDQMVLRDARHIANPTSFGRMPASATTRQAGKSDAFYENHIQDWIAELDNEDLGHIMSLYDIFGNCYCRYEKARIMQPFERMRQRSPAAYAAILAANTAKYESSKTLSLHLGFREKWYDDDDRGTGQRGRTPRPWGGTSESPGLLPDQLGIMPGRLNALKRAGVINDGKGKNRVYKNRRRGVDANYKTDRLQAAYAQGLEQHNLNFSASASGTTSTLLVSAYAYARTMFKASRQGRDLEGLKQYIMACVGYLVGSGMHTCHEIFYTANLIEGLYYITGKYDSLLPMSFRGSNLHTQWEDEFWDIHSR